MYQNPFWEAAIRPDGQWPLAFMKSSSSLLWSRRPLLRPFRATSTFRLLQICFNVILHFGPRNFEWVLDYCFFNKISRNFFVSSMRFTCPTHPIFITLVSLKLFFWNVYFMKNSLCVIFRGIWYWNIFRKSVKRNLIFNRIRQE